MKKYTKVLLALALLIVFLAIIFVFINKKTVTEKESAKWKRKSKK